MSETITFGSVCSGIEAASVAWNPLGWKAAWLSEIEPFPCAVLAHHYPDVPNLGDMTKIAHLIRDGFVPAPDVFCGGTPCQAFSVAGLRNSLDDARGNLSLIFCEIANEIDTRRATDGLLPSVIFWENVPGVLSTKDNAFGCFLGELAGEDCALVAPGGKWPNAGCVFGPKRAIAWRVTDAQYFGVAQRRRRVFVVASAREGFDPTEVLFEFDGVRRDSAPSREAGQDTAGTLASRTDGGGFPGTDEARSGYVQPVDLVAGGQLARCLTTKTRIDAETETLIPTIGAVFVDAPIAFSSKDYGGDAEVDLAPTLRAGGHSNSHANAGVPPAIAFDSRQDPVSSTEVFGALGSSSPQAQAVSYAIQAGALRTNPASGPDGVGVQESIAYTLEARAEVQAVCVTGDITHTLKAEGFDASEDGTGRGQLIVAAAIDIRNGTLEQNGPTMSLQAGGMGDGRGMCINAIPHTMQAMAVRRLTPRECERLQSFPDDYTLIPYGRVVKMEKLERDWIKYLLRGGVMTLEQVCQAAADGPRYKALGNSWCVYNARWIGRRIDRHFRAHSGAIEQPDNEKATA